MKTITAALALLISTTPALAWGPVGGPLGTSAGTLGGSGYYHGAGPSSGYYSGPSSGGGGGYRPSAGSQSGGGGLGYTAPTPAPTPSWAPSLVPDVKAYAPTFAAPSRPSDSLLSYPFGAPPTVPNRIAPREDTLSDVLKRAEQYEREAEKMKKVIQDGGLLQRWRDDPVLGPSAPLVTTPGTSTGSIVERTQRQLDGNGTVYGAKPAPAQ